MNNDQQSENRGSEVAARDWLKGALAIADQAFVSLNNFITFILVAQFCPSRDDVNLYVLAWSIFNIFRVIQERGLAAPYFVFSHEQYRDGVTLLGSSLIHQAIFGIVAAFSFLILSLAFAFHSTVTGIVGCCLVLIFASPFILMRDHLRAVSCAHFRYDIAVFLSAIALMLQIGIVLGLYFLEILSAATVFAAMGVASFGPVAAWHWIRPQKFRVEKHRIKPDWDDTSSYSKWLVTARIFPSIAMGLFPWIVLWVVNEDAAGTLGSCITLANISNMFVFGANYFFLPKAVQALNQRGQSAMIKILLFTAVVFAIALSLLCLVYWFLGDQILSIAFGKSFAGHSKLVATIGLSYLIVSFSTIAGNGMTAIGKPEGLFWGELSFGVVAVFAAVVLIQPFGLMGAAFAMCVASTAATIVEVYYLLKLLDEPTPANHLHEIAPR